MKHKKEELMRLNEQMLVEDASCAMKPKAAAKKTAAIRGSMVPQVRCVWKGRR